MSEKGTPIDLTARVTLYAPVTGSAYHAAGEEVKVGVMVAEKLKSQGYTTEKPSAEAKKGGKA